MTKVKKRKAVEPLDTVFDNIANELSNLENNGESPTIKCPKQLKRDDKSIKSREDVEESSSEEDYDNEEGSGNEEDDDGDEEDSSDENFEYPEENSPVSKNDRDEKNKENNDNGRNIYDFDESDTQVSLKAVEESIFTKSNG